MSAVKSKITAAKAVNNDKTVPAGRSERATAMARRHLAPRGIHEFLLYEAALLDARELDAWLELLTEEAIYWVPAKRDQTDPDRHISLFYDTRSIMNDRIWRLGHPKMFSQNPPVRQVRILSNIVTADEVGEDAQQVVVHSKFIMFEHRLSEQRTFGGDYEHLLVRNGNDWRIARKTVRLVNCDSPLWNIGVPI